MSNLQVILMQEMPKLGQLGDVIKVKAGYARNYLLPKGFARIYTTKAWEEFEAQKQEIIKSQKESRLAKEQLFKELDGFQLETVVQAQEDGALYGSIGQSVIVDLLKERSHVFKRHQVALPNNEAIKEIGDYKVGLKIDHDLEAMLNFSVLSAVEKS